MANIEATVGLTFLDERAFHRAIAPYAQAWEHFDTGELDVARLVLDDAIQLYSFRIDEKTRIEVHYATSTRARLRYDGFRKEEFAVNPSTCTKLIFPVEGRDKPACMVVHMPEAALFAMEEGLYLMQLAVYAKSFYIFRGEEEFKKHSVPIGMECFYPLPAKHSDPDPDNPTVLTDRAVVSGIIDAFEMRFNSLSGVPYFWVRIRCLGLLVDVLIAGDELLPDQIRVGYILSVIAYHVSARPIRRLNDDA